MRAAAYQRLVRRKDAHEFLCRALGDDKHGCRACGGEQCAEAEGFFRPAAVARAVVESGDGGERLRDGGERSDGECYQTAHVAERGHAGFSVNLT